MKSSGAIGENSTTDSQVLLKYLDTSRDPPPPSSDNPEERAERHDFFENRGSGPVAQGSSAQSSNTENKIIPDEPALEEKETEVVKSAVPRRRIAGKRTVEENAPVHAKKERIKCTDLSLVWSLPRSATIFQK